VLILQGQIKQVAYQIYAFIPKPCMGLHYSAKCYTIFWY